jgi:hypothetical protein
MTTATNPATTTIKHRFLRAVMADPSLSSPAKCVMHVLVFQPSQQQNGPMQPGLRHDRQSSWPQPQQCHRRHFGIETGWLDRDRQHEGRITEQFQFVQVRFRPLSD